MTRVVAEFGHTGGMRERRRADHAERARETARRTQNAPSSTTTQRGVPRRTTPGLDA